MMATEQHNLYQHVIAITQDYLGPAAKRFIDRQIASHLTKNPVDLTVQDLDELISWAAVSFALLTDKDPIIREYTQRLRALSNQQRKNR